MTATARDTRYQVPDFYVIAPVYAGAPLFRPDNVLAAILPAGDYVQVTCWYGNMPGYAADGYEDHVVWVSTLGNFTGHIPDDYVHLGGTPNNEDISECG